MGDVMRGVWSLEHGEEEGSAQPPGRSRSCRARRGRWRGWSKACSTPHPTPVSSQARKGLQCLGPGLL